MKTLLIADLQTTDLLYYEDDFRNECYEYCSRRDIDSLPDVESAYHFYKRDDKAKSFKKSEIEPRRRIETDQPAFAPIVIDKFREQPLLFVYTSDELSGVIHFSDYNNPQVSGYLYELLHHYEKSLRALLLMQHGSIESKIKKGQELEKMYLPPLIEEVCKKTKLQLDRNVRDLRNAVMHAKDPVKKSETSIENYAYDLTSFADFYSHVLSLQRDLRRVKNYISFLDQDIYKVSG